MSNKTSKPMRDTNTKMHFENRSKCTANWSIPWHSCFVLGGILSSKSSYEFMLQLAFMMRCLETRGGLTFILKTSWCKYKS